MEKTGLLLVHGMEWLKKTFHCYTYHIEGGIVLIVLLMATALTDSMIANLAFLPVETGDFNLVLKNLDALSGPLYPGLRENRDSTRAYYLLVLHDPRAARRLTGPVSDAAIAARFTGSAGGGGGPNYDLAMEEGDYDRAVLLTRQLLEFLKTNPETPHMSAVQSESSSAPAIWVAPAPRSCATRRRCSTPTM